VTPFLIRRVDVMDPRDQWGANLRYLNTATYGLPPRVAWEALQRVLADWRVGRSSWEPWDDDVRAAREVFARLVGVAPTEVSVGATVSELMGLVATALPSGSTVVLPDGDFASNVFPWMVQADVNAVPLDKIAESIDAQTTLVAFSAVQSSSGEVAPIDDIVAAARHHGALVAVDATQACGWLPLDASRFDAMACHTYKWLMAPRGAAFLVTGAELRERMTPIGAGWYAGDDIHKTYYGPPLRLAADARRFDTSPAWFSWVGARPAFELVEKIGVANIHEHNVSMANRLRAGLGLEPSNSAIVSVDIPDALPRLERAGIRAAVRAGGVRLSCHIYTTPDDVDAAVTALTR
jgi:selenocysteine lyase/cysteine desulfurase